ncbi:MAG: hypothetical protein QF454_05260 [Candidatus Thalassarchaeaceae archaeon]|jgi:hypothetical protein|nr:hypothetical protein [Candidatus Thalassarchaeaceae archaeon]
MSGFSGLEIRRIVADGDLDGLLSAAILKRFWPDATVLFTHPAEIRSGRIDDWIGTDTALLDLPFHPDCGLYIDHHLTNKPTNEQEKKQIDTGGYIIWQDKLSAARVAFESFFDLIDLSDFDVWMDMVDRLDGGKITPAEFLSDHPVVWIGRTISATDPEYCRTLLNLVTSGMLPVDIVNEEIVSNRIGDARLEFVSLQDMLTDRSEIIDRLAIVRLDGAGIRTNGYLVTAHFGDACDACMIIHGYVDGSIGNKERWPLSASFYSNSFLHEDGGVFDLTKLACAFDVNGGGHANACGCRLQPISSEGDCENRPIDLDDIQKNINQWLSIWADR